MIIYIRLSIVFILFLSFKQTLAQQSESNYAFITIEGKVFSKKLNVTIDLGDTPEQLELGKEYSQLLSSKKSYAAILNFMIYNGYELVETLTTTMEIVTSGNGGGGTSGIIFIMKTSTSR